MKTIIALLTTTVLVAGATSAMAVEQGSDEAPGYALSLRAAQGFGAVQTGRSFGGAFASARVPGALRTGSGHHKKMSPPDARAVDPRSFGNARGDAAGGFGGYPTDYLNQRFGDFQSQGRL